jgi:hypothetical protein
MDYALTVQEVMPQTISLATRKLCLISLSLAAISRTYFEGLLQTKICDFAPSDESSHAMRAQI